MDKNISKILLLSFLFFSCEKIDTNIPNSPSKETSDLHGDVNGNKNPITSKETSNLNDDVNGTENTIPSKENSKTKNKNTTPSTYEKLFNQNKNKGNYISLPQEMTNNQKSNFNTEYPGLNSKDFLFINNSKDGSCNLRLSFMQLFFKMKEENKIEELISILENDSLKYANISPKFKKYSQYEKSLNMLKSLKKRTYLEIITAMNDHDFNNVVIEHFFRHFMGVYCRKELVKELKFKPFLRHYKEYNEKHKIDSYIDKNEINKLSNITIFDLENSHKKVINSSIKTKKGILPDLFKYILGVNYVEIEKDYDTIDEFIEGFLSLYENYQKMTPGDIGDEIKFLEENQNKVLNSLYKIIK